MTMRWNEEQLADFEKRRAGWDKTGHVRTHEMHPPEPPRPVAPKKRHGTRRGPSELELLLAQQLTLTPQIPNPKREHKHIPDRDFRLDFAWPDRKIGLEVQGMVHRIKGRFKGDIEKRALGLLAGWRVLEVSGSEIRSGQAITWLLEILDAECDHVWTKTGSCCTRCGAKG